MFTLPPVYSTAMTKLNYAATTSLSAPEPSIRKMAKEVAELDEILKQMLEIVKVDSNIHKVNNQIYLGVKAAYEDSLRSNGLKYALGNISTTVRGYLQGDVRDDGLSKAEDIMRSSYLKMKECSIRLKAHLAIVSFSTEEDIRLASMDDCLRLAKRILARIPQQICFTLGDDIEIEPITGARRNSYYPSNNDQFYMRATFKDNWDTKVFYNNLAKVEFNGTQAITMDAEEVPAKDPDFKLYKTKVLYVKGTDADWSKHCTYKSCQGRPNDLIPLVHLEDKYTAIYSGHGGEYSATSDSAVWAERTLRSRIKKKIVTNILDAF